jgi:hypothetical protein
VSDDATIIEISNGLSAEGKGFCIVSMGGEPIGQMDPVEVRTMALHWLEVAEAAEMDAMVFAALGDLALDFDTRVHFIGDLRRRRDPR